MAPYPPLQETGARFTGGLMPNQKTSPAAYVAKTTAFGGLFGTLCVVFDPTTAFSFTLVATVLLAAL